MDDWKKRVEEGIVRSPFGRHLQLRVVDVESDRVRIELPFAPHVCTVGDLIHGGAISSLVDAAATGACWASPELAPGSRGTTIGLQVHFMAPARGCNVVADARVRKRGGQISVVEVGVHDPDGVEVSRATVTYKLSPPPPGLVETLQRAFAGRSPEEQQALLATLERSGAAMYGAWAATESDPARKAELERAAEREIENAEVLEKG